jgi:hypothetical protein
VGTFPFLVLLFVGYRAYGNVANPLLVALLWWPKVLGHHCQCCCLLASYCLSSRKLTSWLRPKPAHFPTADNSSSSAKRPNAGFYGYVKLQVKGKGFSKQRLIWHWFIVVVSGVLTIVTCVAAVWYIISDSTYYHAFANL